MGEQAQLREGQVVEGRWRVLKKLGEGGFGAVYKVQDVRGGQQHALKTEGANEQVQILKMEVFVLEELARIQGRHFCRIEDRGRTGDFNFVVMTLVGPSLQDLRKAQPPQHFSVGTALRVGLQCLEALEDLHKIGYLHRDVKPGNFTIGRDEIGEQRKVYILDFGMCRRYLNDAGRVRTPRSAAGFRGTVRYASLNCHLSRELSRMDDLEVWFYQQIEITKGAVTWRNEQDKDAVGRCKQRLRDFGPDLQALVSNCPPSYTGMFQYIVSLRYWDEPNYTVIYTALRQTMASVNVRDADPYDWEARRGPTGASRRPY